MPPSKPEKRKSKPSSETEPSTPLPKRAKTKPSTNNPNEDEDEDEAPSPPPASNTPSPSSPTRSLPASPPPPPPTVFAPGEEWKQPFRIEKINIISSSRIVQKVTLAAGPLIARPPMGDPRPVLMELRARGPATGKLVTVVEIAKRQVGKMGGGWFEYCSVGTVGEERGDKGEEGGKEKGKERMVGEDGEDGEEEESFETMKTPFEREMEGRKKVRKVPVMTVYLCQSRIEELRKLHGEQTNAEETPNGLRVKA